MEVPPAGNRRVLIKSILNKAYKPVVEKYLSQDRSYSYKSLHIMVRKGVFHPGFFYSTEFLIKQLATINLKDSSFLELGAGTGLIALYAAQQGAQVTASDISSLAVANLEENKALTKLPITIIHSDLFANIPVQQFDVIVLNPPFYRGKPEDETEYAWYYGKDESYFTRLFSQLPQYMHGETIVYMVLSEDCQLEAIKQTTIDAGLTITIAAQKRKYWELLYIFEIGK